MKRQRSIDGRVSGSSNTNKKRIKEKNCKHEMKCTHNVNNCGYECSSIDGNPLVAQQTAEDQLRQNHDQHLQQRAIEASRHQQEMNNALVAQRSAEDQLRQNQDDQRQRYQQMAKGTTTKTDQYRQEMKAALVAQQTAEDQLRQNHDQHLQQRAIEASRHQQEMNNALVAQRTAEDQLRQNQDDQRRQHKERDKRRETADKTHGRSRGTLGLFHNGKTTNANTLKYLAEYQQQQQQRQQQYSNQFHYNYNAAKENHLDLPDVWMYQISTFFDMNDLARHCQVAKWFQPYWENFLSTRIVRVPQDLPTIRRGLEIGEILNNARERTLYTKEHPLQILLCQGNYATSNDDDDVSMSIIHFSVSIIGVGCVGCNKTVINGSFFIEGTQSDHVTLKNMSVRPPPSSGVASCNAASDGVIGFGNASFTMENMVVEKFRRGVTAHSTIGKIHNVEVKECTESGIRCIKSGTITISGEHSSVHHNHWGLSAQVSPSTINLVHPLTIENVCTGPNRGSARIQIVDNDGNILEAIDSSDGSQVHVHTHVHVEQDMMNDY